MSKLTLDEAINHCLEVAEQNEAKAQKIGVQFLGTTKDREATECRECAADHRQLAEWLTDYKELRSIVHACNILAVDAFAVENLCKELKELREENKVLMHECDRLIKEKGELLKKSEQVAEYKRLLKAAVEDFAKLDRENAKNKNCMMPEMDCAACPLSWDSVDDRVEPCHSWRYANEALKLIGDETNGS